MSSLPFGDRVGRSAWRLVPKRAVSGVIGWWGRRPLSPDAREGTLRGFAQKFHIDPAEAEQGFEAYASRDAFFTRRLRPEARPIDASPGVVVHPSDGIVVESGIAEGGKLIQTKGVTFSLGALLADEEQGARFTGGSYLITYLSPRDYHRVHSPLDGRVVGWRHVPGTLFSVNARSVVREPGLFAKNERFVTIIESDAGACAVVMVAAIGVGHITAAFDPDVRTHASAFNLRRRDYETPRTIVRGGEIGTFHLGSTTVVVFEPGRVTLDAWPPGSSTRMGGRLGRLASGAGGVS